MQKVTHIFSLLVNANICETTFFSYYSNDSTPLIWIASAKHSALPFQIQWHRYFACHKRAARAYRSQFHWRSSHSHSLHLSRSIAPSHSSWLLRSLIAIVLMSPLALCLQCVHCKIGCAIYEGNGDCPYILYNMSYRTIHLACVPAALPDAISMAWTSSVSHLYIIYNIHGCSSSVAH